MEPENANAASKSQEVVGQVYPVRPDLIFSFDEGDTNNYPGPSQVSDPRFRGI